MAAPFVAVLALGVLLTVQPIWPPPRVAGPSVDAKRLADHVVFLTAAPHSHRDVARLDELAARIADGFQNAGARVEEQTFTARGDPSTYRNVIAHVGPEAGERVVVVAHYDAHGEHAGADDDASGVAALLELAPLLSRTHLDRHVELVAATLEEPPFFGTEDMGSAHHAQRRNAEGVSIRAMLALEMLGYYADLSGTQTYPHALLGAIYPRRGDFIAVVGCFADAPLVRTVKRAMAGATRLPVWSLCGPRSLPGVDWSDQRNYWRRGIPAVMITDTSFFRNRGYHTARDTADTLDYTRLALAVRGVYDATVALANQ